MIFSIFFYNLILAITTSFSYLSSKLNDKFLKKIFLFLSLGVIIFISSFRSLSVGTDSKVYFQEYEKIDPNNNVLDNIIINFGNFEPGFVFFNHFFSKLSFNYTTVLFLYSNFIWYLLYKTFRDQKENFYIAIFFFFTNFLFFTFNGLRQAISSVIIFYAVTFLLNGKTVKFLLTTLFASLFHFSAIVMLPLIFLNKKKHFSTSSWGVLSLIALLIPIKYLYTLIFKIAYFFPFYGTYSGRDDFYLTSHFSFGVFYQVLLGFVIIYYYKIVANSPKKIFFFNLSLIANLLYNLFYSNPFINRLIVYFLFFQLYAFVFIFDHLIKNKKYDILFIFTIIFILVFSYKIFVNDSGASPYLFK